MSNGGENPISENPAACAALGENGLLATSPAAGVDAEGRAADAAQRPSKAELMAEIARLSAEGDSNRTIARKLGVPRQTVDRSMRKLRRRRAEAAAQKAAEAFPAAVARLEAVYRQSMNWHGPTHKKTQAGKAAMLGKAIRATLEISKLHAAHLEAMREDALPGHNRPSAMRRRTASVIKRTNERQP
jgi:DNA-binding CsgD family transcriptional regulator